MSTPVTPQVRPVLLNGVRCWGVTDGEKWHPFAYLTPGRAAFHLANLLDGGPRLAASACRPGSSCFSSPTAPTRKLIE